MNTPTLVAEALELVKRYRLMGRIALVAPNLPTARTLLVTASESATCPGDIMVVSYFGYGERTGESLWTTPGLKLYTEIREHLGELGKRLPFVIYSSPVGSNSVRELFLQEGKVDDRFLATADDGELLAFLSRDFAEEDKPAAEGE